MVLSFLISAILLRLVILIPNNLIGSNGHTYSSIIKLYLMRSSFVHMYVFNSLALLVRSNLVDFILIVMFVPPSYLLCIRCARSSQSSMSFCLNWSKVLIAWNVELTDIPFYMASSSPYS